ncbi:MAG: ABC transporter substrate-binding protein [Oscillospiraceae bacterium]|nr:ABC transporter substrate-binding protein [Oscillospiraceae bacterium]
MKRFFAIVLAVLLLISLTACAGTQSTSDKLVVGVCQLVPHEALDAATKGFVETLEAEFGDKIEIKVELGGGDTATCAPIVNAFVAENVDLIMANATPALQAAAAATSDIPILGTSVTEYGVALDIDDFNGTVGTNISGTSDLAPLKDQAAMVKEWFPEAKNVGLLYCSGEANSKYQVDTVKTELEALGFTCTLYAFTDSNDMQAVTQKAADASDVIYAPTDNTIASAGGTVDGVCRAAGVPVISGEENACQLFGVATLSISYYNLGVTTGKMAIEILKGEKDIAQMPIAYDEAPVKKYNKELCQALNLTPPEGYVAIGE